MLAPGAHATYVDCARTISELMPRMDESPLSLLRPTGSSAAEDAAYNTHIVHDASQCAVNFRSHNGLIAVKFQSTREIHGGRGGSDTVACQGLNGA